MMGIDLEKIKAAAQGAMRCVWGDSKDWADLTGDRGEGEFIATASPDMVLMLISELERLSAIVEKHIDPKQVMLTGLNVHNGSFDIGLEGGPVRLFAAAFADYFKESAASNYIEMSLASTDPAVGELLVTLQRKQGKTPHQLRREAEERAEKAEADVRRLDSGVIMTNERNDFGEEYKCERRGLDLRAMIDEAMEAGK